MLAAANAAAMNAAAANMAAATAAVNAQTAMAEVRKSFNGDKPWESQCLKMSPPPKTNEFVP